MVNPGVIFADYCLDLFLVFGLNEMVGERVGGGARREVNEFKWHPSRITPRLTSRIATVASSVPHIRIFFLHFLFLFSSATWFFCASHLWFSIDANSKRISVKMGSVCRPLG